MSDPLRIGLVGAGTMLGQEIAELLVEQADLTFAELRAFGEKESSFDEDEDELDSSWFDLRSGPTDFSGLDAVIVCGSAKDGLEEVRQSLRAEVPCIDCSGALLSSEEVPVMALEPGAPLASWSGPLVNSPTETSLVWFSVARELNSRVGVLALSGTVLHSASAEGKAGVEELSTQTLALLNQNPLPDSRVFSSEVAFDCFAHPEDETDARSESMAHREARLVLSLRRLLGEDVGVSVTSVQVPTFAGEASILALRTRDPVDPVLALKWLNEGSEVNCVAGTRPVGMRETVGGSSLCISRVRSDVSAADPQRSLLMWVSADPVQLAAQNAVGLLRSRFLTR